MGSGAKRRSPRPSGSPPLPCEVPGCGRPMKSQGLCGAHAWRLKTEGDVEADKPVRGPQGVDQCVVDGCSAPPQARGMCKSHWGKWRRYGDPLWVPPPKVTHRCSVPDCEGEVSTRGLCGKHYQRYRKYGDPLTTFQDERIESTGTCRIDGCIRPDKKKGLCHRHLNAYYTYGDPLISRRVRRFNDQIEAVCTIDGCGRPHSKRGYCAAHYQRMRQGLVSRRSAFNVSEKVLRHLYGSPCVACGSRNQVSLDHVIPLARGGLHCEGKFQPLCMDCNRAKNDRLMIEWKYAKMLADSASALSPRQKRSHGSGPRVSRRSRRPGTLGG